MKCNIPVPGMFRMVWYGPDGYALQRPDLLEGNPPEGRVLFDEVENKQSRKEPKGSRVYEAEF